MELITSRRLPQTPQEFTYPQSGGRHQSPASLKQIPNDKARVAQYQKQAIGDHIEFPLLRVHITQASLESHPQKADQHIKHRQLDKAVKQGLLDTTARVDPARDIK